MRLTVGSLFAGIGGFDLGFTRAGFDVQWQIEIDPWCRAVLAQHWPEVTRYADVRTVHGPHVADAAQYGLESGREQDRPEYSRANGESGVEFVRGGTHVADAERAERRPQAEGRRDDGNGHDARRKEAASGTRERGDDDLRGTCLVPVDVICGGFPCQPHSLAGRRAGSDDSRDLWPEFARLIRECRPRWVVAENVPGLLSSDAGRFFGAVLGDLAACGYDAEWDCLPASAFSAPHRRDRVWLVAYRQCDGRDGRAEDAGWTTGPTVTRHSGEHVADADGDDRQRRGGDVQMGRIWGRGQAPHYDDVAGTQWRVEPAVGELVDGLSGDVVRFAGRVAHGVPQRVQKLKGLGNAIVPAIAEWLGARILAAEGRAREDGAAARHRG